MRLSVILMPFACVALSWVPLCAEQTQTDTTFSSRVFELGEIVVTAQRDKSPFNRLSSEKLTTFNRADASSALSLLPGVTLNNEGDRNESTVYIRGFDLRQVPLFIDGIPVYAPYDGYVDLARFSTADLSEVHISKGFSSVIYGPNTKGGAINLVSRKPATSFEYTGRMGVMSGRGYMTSLTLGSRQEKFYLSSSFSRLKRETYPLSDDFGPTGTQSAGMRDNADRDDTKWSLRVGLTPDETSEYTVGFVSHRGEKGNPVYTGSDPAIRLRYWRWPRWDKQSLFFIFQNSLREGINLKTRVFFDTFKNTVEAYDDATYTTQDRRSSFTSMYDDYTYGANGEISTNLTPYGVVTVAAHFKHDVHREHNLGEPVRTTKDNTVSLGLENVHQIHEKATLVAGLAFNLRNSLQAEDYDSATNTISSFPNNDNAAINAQIGAFFTFSPAHAVSLTLARSTRFATMKDRYSYRLGSAIPNPDLGSEASINYEASYTFTAPDGETTFQGSLFFNDIRDIIQQVDDVATGVYQMQNTGKARFLGGEFGIFANPLRGLKPGLTYSYIHRNNVTNPAVKLVGVPDHKLLAYVTYTPVDALSLNLNAEFNSSRYATSTGTKISGFGLVNGKVSGRPHPDISLEAGINNAFDRNYSLSEGYPEAGRNFFFNVVFGRP